ncbi:Glycerophosphoryl diester phosphodiesterase [[Actinomadura] parvosata subsp. kistnae]|uniref:Glycerophosphodiester phosphodiesterase n=1 Tax=[Actinomadura] parvosata subsp. kistnae TaxID=1909395 RepID=A0A1V0AI35_9ACTN|nr:glycerophosphodiester phosphodiesterase family protein [Nonomuraea sp. ATCC 55076]AQZ69878.1 glycerophosphodiester phosphodiesterase [Nonomuraea sp. ATCC 55076]SPL90193.1 Glycerophosphoryl diester phosphodiesterase [Actinomadura parvosata subsp. kistnae]
MFRRLAVLIATSLTFLPLATATPADAATVINVAHRGASAYAPENTIAAFDLAAEQGADLFELDVQETKDHELVLMHDTTLSRTTNAEQVFPGLSPWNVGDLTLDQIRELDAGSWVSDKYEGERVPTLGEVLREMSGSGMGLLLEVKSPELYAGIESRIAAELRRHPSWLAPGRLVVQSFDWESMRRFDRLLPEVPIGLLGMPSTGDLPGLAKFADQINPPYTTLTASYVRRVHALGMKLLTWTVDGSSSMRRMIGYRVDGIITNRPDVLSDLLGS